MKFILKVIFWCVYSILSFAVTIFGINGFLAMLGYNKRYGEDANVEWNKLLEDGMQEFISWF